MIDKLYPNFHVVPKCLLDLADYPLVSFIRKFVVDHQFQATQVIAFLNELKLNHRLDFVELLSEVSTVD